jgi:signal transduction histidine kinase
VFLSVHNEGQPIPAELLPTIFDAFRRGGTPAVERSRTGLGLGLHIAQAIARAHGGRIEVDSARERGTTFTVVLPRDPMPVM